MGSSELVSKLNDVEAAINTLKAKVDQHKGKVDLTYETAALVGYSQVLNVAKATASTLLNVGAATQPLETELDAMLLKLHTLDNQLAAKTSTGSALPWKLPDQCGIWHPTACFTSPSFSGIAQVVVGGLILWYGGKWLLGRITERKQRGAA